MYSKWYKQTGSVRKMSDANNLSSFCGHFRPKRPKILGFCVFGWQDDLLFLIYQEREKTFLPSIWYRFFTNTRLLKVAGAN